MARKSRKETAAVAVQEADAACRAAIYVRLSVEDTHISAVQPNTVDLQSRIDLRLSEEGRAENCSDFSHIVQSCGRTVHKFYGTI